MTGININRNKWSVLDRAEIIKKITSIEPDILVIGGGITGAGIALDAASRGLKVAVVEKQDFSAGTSSRSTKLIHGGLRYLAQFEFRLVRNIGTERKIIYNHAQHIVFPEKMLLPVIKNGTYTRLAVSFGVFLYDIIAGVDWKEQCKMLNKKEMLGMEPLLNPDILKAGVLYYEYKTKDSRLTVEIFKKAVELGALAINYFEAETFIYENGKITGIIGNDTLSGKQFRINAKFVVNASGPWVDKLREKNHSLTNKRIHLTKGVHIVVSKTRLPLNHSVYFDVGDERMIFTIPEDNCVYIGTTDTDYNGNLEHPSLTQTDALYLIKAVNNMFPSVNLTIGDIISSWAGLRPLIHKEGKKPSELSRRDEIFISKSGLISIAGGKLTGYRTMAKKIVDIIMKKIVSSTGQQFIQCKTNNIKLSGGDFPFQANQVKLHEYAGHKYDEAKQTGITFENFNRLFYLYGTNIDHITEKAYEYYQENKDTRICWLKAEIWYAVNYEMTTNLCDFFIRRNEIFYFERNEIPPILDIVTDEMAILLSWTPEQKNRSKADFMKEYEQAVTIK